MPSIIGQTLQGAGPSLGAIGSSLGSLFSPSSASAATIPSAPTVDNAGVTAPTVDTSSWGSGSAAPAPSLLPSSDPLLGTLGGGGGGGPAPSGSPFSLLTGTTGDATSNPLAPLQAASMAPGSAGTTTDPSSQPWYNQIADFLKTPKGAAVGIGGLGNLVESIMRWNTMRTLSNPAALASGASKMYTPMNAAMKRAIIGPVTAAAQETGQINAPGLYAQSVGSALAPYQYAMQEKALQDYITALTASGGAYPEGGLFGAGGPSYQGGTAYGNVTA